MFTSKFLKIAFPIFLVLVGLFAVIQLPFIGIPVLGGVITQGILGGFSGKVGPVVGGKWKDIDYMRGYVVPSNPNTPDQQAVRTKFSALVNSARGILTSILQPYWDPFNSNMSGFNKWISENYALSSSTGVIGATAIMSQGTLEGTTSLTSTYATADGATILTWNSDIFGNGANNDSVLAIVYDLVNKNFYFALALNTRSEGTLTVSLPTGLTATNVITWVAFTSGTGSSLIVSDSRGDVCAAP